MVSNWKKLCDLGYEDAVMFASPDYDSAIIGVSQDGRVVYSYERMVEYLVAEYEMSVEEAIDFIDYNTLGTTVEGDPIVVFDLW